MGLPFNLADMGDDHPVSVIQSRLCFVDTLFILLRISLTMLGNKHSCESVQQSARVNAPVHWSVVPVSIRNPVLKYG